MGALSARHPAGHRGRSGLGLGADVLSAYRAFASGYPGFGGFSEPRPANTFETMPWWSFPGGNTGLARFFAKFLIPEAIAGGRDPEDVILGDVDFGALDRPGQPIRMRMRSTAVHVGHEGDAEGPVRVAYERDGTVHVVRARTVVMASGSWINRNIVMGASERLQGAWAKLSYAPILSVNVALRNWRFLHELGITAFRWFEGFGFSANIRRPMILGGESSPLDPDRPIVLTLYVSFSRPGTSAAEQGAAVRSELLSTLYVDYERQIRSQLAHLFQGTRFDPRRDIAGIVLNRWGHAYVVAEPGFHFGTPSAPTASDVIREGHGTIRFGHSELLGHQHWPGATSEGRRAAREAIARL